ncbi:cyclase/dehydrase protein [Minicystis rosea]|nr:cyclase/dehydrase protein [Minicystis rosea]
MGVMASKEGARGGGAKACAGIGQGDQETPARGAPTPAGHDVPNVAFAALGPNATRVTKSVTIGRPRAELFGILRRPGLAARLVKDAERVQLLPGVAGSAHWTVRGRLGLRLTGVAETIAEIPDQLIAWRSPPGASVPNAGSISLADAPGDRGTEVKVVLAYRLRGGALGRLLGKLVWLAPAELVRGALRRLQQLVEAGEIATIEGQPSGRRSRRLGG